MSIKISVIIPVYNVEKYLEKCISSVINQTLKDIEIILINDGSTDNSLKICKEFENKDKRIKLFTQDNKGLGFARNLALLNATGNFVFFLDSDDWIELDSMEKLYNHAKDTSSDVVISGWKRIEEFTGEVTVTRRDIINEYGEVLIDFKKDDVISKIFSGKINLMACSCLIKRELFINNYLFFPNTFHEDLYVMPKIYFYAKKISYFNESLYNWLVRKDSITNSFSLKHATGIGGIFIIWKNFLIQEDLYDKYKADLLCGLVLYLNLIRNRTKAFAKREEVDEINEYANFLKASLNDDFIEGFEKRMDLLDIDRSNFDFSKKFNTLYTYVKVIKSFDLKIALYGFGLIGKYLYEQLEDNIVLIVDRNLNSIGCNDIPCCIPEEINKYEFDRLLISVLGREKQIIEDIGISKDKILTINIKQPCSIMEFFSIEINKESDNYFDVVFIPHNDYQYRTMGEIANKLLENGIKSCFIDLTDYHKDERTRIAAKEYPEHPFYDLSKLLKGEISYKMVMCMNDWENKVINPLLIQLKDKGVKTVALIEGINDYLDKDTGRKRDAYQTVEYVLLTGEHDLQFFENKKSKCYIVGIPRLKALMLEDINFPPKPLVVINVNFTYGVLENERERWLLGVIRACDQLNLDYVITQHPSDTAYLDKFNVSNENMYDTIRKASLVVSRFSSIILESLCLGKPAVYHNPHNEQAVKFQDPMGAYSLSFDIESLKSAISYELSLDCDYRQRGKDFLNYHADIDSPLDSLDKSTQIIEKILKI